MWIKFYTPVFILQIFCLIHAYKNKSTYYWYILIIVFPFIGSLIYLYCHFYSRDNVETISEVVKQNKTPNYSVDKLINEAQVSNTITSKLNLADEYYDRGDMEQAMILYQSCITGYYTDDVEINKRLLLAYYENERYADAVQIGEKFNSDKSFQNSDAKLAYAWSLFYMDEAIRAEEIFKELDVRYSNHAYRYEYTLFLEDTNQSSAAREKLSQLVQEIDDMESHERKLKKDVIRKIKAANR